MKRVCIICDTGNGRIRGHNSWYSFLGLPDVEISGFADSNPEMDPFVFEQNHAKRRYADWREMITKERPDITVCTSRLPVDHEQQIRFALEHDSHVLCEKPLVADLRTGDELIALAKKKKLHIQVLHLARFAGAFRKMREMIRAGEIGRPLSCLLRGKEDTRGGGEDMIVLGSHLFDLAVWLFGAPASVFAAVRQVGRPLRASDRLPTEEPLGLCAGDDIFARFTMPEAVSTIFESRRDMVPRGKCWRMGIVVTGTKGQLAFRYDGPRELRICRDFPTPPEDDCRFEVVPVPADPSFPGSTPFPYEEVKLSRTGSGGYFVENNRRAAWNLMQAIDGKEKLISSGADALHSLEMIQGVYASSLAEKTINFPLRDRKHPLE